MNTVTAFPVDQWFDICKPLKREDVELAEAQMMLYAVKDGLDPECREARQEYRRMRAAVKQHNEALKHAAAQP